MAMAAVELDARKYWRDEFHAVANAAHLQEFMIFDTEPTQTSNGKVQECLAVRTLHSKLLSFSCRHVLSILFPSQWALYDMQLARSDAPAEEMFVHSHLGNILHPGDLAWGCVSSPHHIFSPSLPSHIAPCRPHTLSVFVSSLEPLRQV